jgi:protein TonB
MRNPWPVAVSFTSQLIAVGIILTVPMLKIPRLAWTPPLVLYVPQRVPPPAPATVERRGNPQSTVSPLRLVFKPRFAAPQHIPVQVALINDPPSPALGLSSTNETSPVSSLADAVTLPSVKSTVEASTPKPRPKPAIVRSSTGVQQALLIHQVKPLYPPLARAARISGVVRLAAVISRDGSIQNLQLLSGPPLLVKGAIEAVQQWRYKPTLLSGEAVEVMTEIEVTFTLSN